MFKLQEQTELFGFILLWLILLPAPVMATVVYTTAELMSAVNNKEKTIELNAATFNLTSNLMIRHDCNIAPYPQRSGTGGVTINGQFRYVISLQNAEINVGGNNPNNILTFKNASGEAVSVISLEKPTFVTFNYCNFSNPSSGDGLNTLGGDYELTVICNNCYANYNYADGFGMHNYGGSAIAEHTVILNNCTAIGNGWQFPSSYTGDGASSHNPGQKLYINGGVFHSNGKTGAAIIGGSQCYISNAEFYNNGTISHIADIYAADSSYLEVNGVKLKNLNYPQAGLSHLWLENSNLKLQNCVMQNSLGSEGKFIYCKNTCDIQIKNCIFDGKPSNISSIKVDPNTTGFVKNCTFYSNIHHIDMSQVTGLIIANNILKDAGKCAIVCDDNVYSTNLENGFNNFYGNILNFCGNTNELFPTDLTSDPFFADETIGDFHLKSQEGRWQLSVPSKDITGDTFVNLTDYAEFLKVSNDSNGLLWADLNGDLTIDMEDFSIFAENYLSYNYKCDLTGDNFVNLLDYAKFAVAMKQFGNDLEQCDFDEDGKITLGDLEILFNDYLIWQYPDRWVKDNVTSPCIDAGNPAEPWQNEPLPNGRRINMGTYGNTPEASKSAATPMNMGNFNGGSRLYFQDYATAAKNQLSKIITLPLKKENIDWNIQMNIFDLAILSESRLSQE